ncbi:MAG: family 43 glycosylhydrolase [Sphingobacteriaceae bacterium]
MTSSNDKKESKIVLKSPKGLEFSFIVSIQQIQSQTKQLCMFEISGCDPVILNNKTCSYILESREHDSYLDLFTKLSGDFGLRLPQNRKQELEKPPLNSAYKEVLTSNLNTDVLYGYGDPALIKVDADNTSNYYLVVTSNDAPNSFPIFESQNLTEWKFMNFVFPKGKKPQWAADGEFVSDYWAPEIHKIGKEFRVCFVARDKATYELCIGMARSSNPEGPYLAHSSALLKGNVIDPHIFVADDGTTYLFWKEDNNDVWPGKLIEVLYENPQLITMLFDTPEDQKTAIFIQTLWPWIKTHPPMEKFLIMQVFIEAVISKYTQFYKRLQQVLPSQTESVQKQIRNVLNFMKTPMYAQRLSSDGLRIIGQRTKIIENDLDWEAHLVEGMWLTKHGDRYYLFYAGNDFSTDKYGIGVAIAEHPLGPYLKMQKPFLQSSEKWWAPGHPSVVIDPDGKPQLFLHAYFPHKAGYKEFRALLSVPLLFEKDKVRAG